MVALVRVAGIMNGKGFLGNGWWMRWLFLQQTESPTSSQKYLLPLPLSWCHDTALAALLTAVWGLYLHLHRYIELSCLSLHHQNVLKVSYCCSAWQLNMFGLSRYLSVLYWEAKCLPMFGIFWFLIGVSATCWVPVFGILGVCDSFLAARLVPITGTRIAQHRTKNVDQTYCHFGRLDCNVMIIRWLKSKFLHGAGAAGHYGLKCVHSEIILRKLWNVTNSLKQLIKLGIQPL